MLGRSISKRMRQISIDDSSSMSDLAQLIVADLGSTSPSIPLEEAEVAPDRLLSSTLPATLLLNNHLGANVSDVELSQSNHF